MEFHDLANCYIWFNFFPFQSHLSCCQKHEKQQIRYMKLFKTRRFNRWIVRRIQIFSSIFTSTKKRSRWLFFYQSQCFQKRIAQTYLPTAMYRLKKFRQRPPLTHFASLFRFFQSADSCFSNVNLNMIAILSHRQFLMNMRIDLLRLTACWFFSIFSNHVQFIFVTQILPCSMSLRSDFQ